ncbi:VOC family protein [Schumannella sp. 10F1B-5-1]|uniref:VOC family protein n=1 Tax=Schumannella sp. 10F1B-5-1 TaxID=2590780 RepID=UPI001130EE5C|nr:VOC family protein [Schumannella sp. 10F1B-5-1]TPW70124.1 VOC family protein [Schumannella sp. 10F1B-5-1]
MTDWTARIPAVTLFVEDVAAAKEFYGRVFELPVHWEDENSVVFVFGPTMINLLQVGEAADLVGPAPVGDAEAGVRVQFTLDVDDVDARAELLRSRGVELLNGPMDRPWGIRTAAFRDPDGHVWEIAGPIAADGAAGVADGSAGAGAGAAAGEFTGEGVA